MKYNVNWGDGVFAVPDIAADRLKLANGKSVKTLLYILGKKITDMDFDAIAAALDISAEDAEDAVSYWQQVGVLYPEGGVPSAAAKKSEEEAARKSVQPPSDIKERKAREAAAKMLSPEEIADRIKNSDEIKFLFDGAESSLGKILNYTEQRTLIWLHDYYSIASDLLLMIMDFSKQIGRADIGFAEKIAISWHDNGISTHELAAREITLLKNYYSLEGQVAAKLGLNRTLTPTEKKYVKEWSSKNISLDLIVQSYEKTVDAIGKVKFSYMNKILSGWHENGIFTAAAVKKENAKSEKKSAGADSGEHSYNLDLLVAHAMNSTPKIKKQ